MIRRQKGMRFLGGYYAFPGGKVEPADGDPLILSRCSGVSPADASLIVPTLPGVPALAYWVTAARELLEETGILLACDADGRPVSVADPGEGHCVDQVRLALMADEAPLATLLQDRGWYLDVRKLRYLSHYITPPSSPIRFTARFFLAPVPSGQEPKLFEEEASEGFWIEPGEGFRRYRSGEMPMAEPAEASLGYLAEFPSLEALWTAHADGRHKFHGILDRVDAAGIPRDRWALPGSAGTAG